MDKPNTLQEAIQIIESANIKINELSAKCDASDTENLKLRKKNDELSSEIFGLKSSVESEQKISADFKAKFEISEKSKSDAESKLAEVRKNFSELQVKFDELSKKDMDVETRASAKAAQIVGESGIEKPVAVAPESEELSMEEISDKLSKADGREKALLMEKYGAKISAYLKGKK